MKDGVIADFTVTEKMLQHFIRKVHARKFFNPEPARARLRALRLDAGRTQGDQGIRPRRRAPRGVHDPEPMAAAIGAGMPVDDRAARWSSTSAAAPPRSR